jgi:outer membrane protein assembly factor BamB
VHDDWRVRAGFALALLAAPAGGGASDWPQLWGPQVTAAVEEPVMTGGVKLEVLWRRPVGSGFSGIAVAGERGFTGESDGTNDQAIGFDVKTGATLWRTLLGPTYRGHDGSRDGPIATPAIGGGRVFMPGPHGALVAMDAASGRELWRRDLPKELQVKLPFYGFGASPVLVGDRLVLQVGGSEKSGLMAFESASGKLAWSSLLAETKGDSTGYTMAAPVEVGGARQVVALGHDRVFGVRVEDGSLVWSHMLGEPEEPTRAPLPLANGRLLLPLAANAVLLEVAKAGGALQAKEVWRSPRLKSSLSPNVAQGAFVYGFNGQFLVCLDAASGEARWRQKIYGGSLIRVGRHLLILGEQSGTLRLVEATPETYRSVAEAAVFNPGAQSSTGPSYADGRIFVRNTEEMVAVSLDGAPARATAEVKR